MAATMQRNIHQIDITSLDASLIKSAYCPTKLFVGGLSKKSTSKKLRDYFSKYGRVLDCVAMTKGDGSARSFGFVTLHSLQAAQSCLGDAHILDGHVLDVKPTESKTTGTKVTATVDRKDKTAELPLPAKLRAPPGLASLAPAGMRAPPGLPEPLPQKQAQQEEEQDSDASSTAPPSSASARDDSDEEMALTDSTDDSPAVTSDLPSVGAALHETGGCKPCNFFAKGTCGSGPDCGFCHFTHEKRRATRQEKRERHERWLQKQAASAAAGADAAAEDETDSAPDSRWTKTTMLQIFAAMRQTQA